jgi:hypothetical protein
LPDPVELFSPAVVAWVQERIKTIPSTTDNDMSILSFIVSLLKDLWGHILPDIGLCYRGANISERFTPHIKTAHLRSRLCMYLCTKNAPVYGALYYGFFEAGQ